MGLLHGGNTLTHDQRREQILAAARAVVARTGIKGVRLSEVAAAVGISVSALYRYFPSKDALLSAALQQPVSARQANAEARREEIVAAALRLFARQGFRATTMAEIGDALGITQGAIYRWFAGKEDILAHVLSDRLSPLAVLNGGRAEPTPAADLGSDLQRLGQALIDAVHANKDIWRFIFTEGMNNPEAAAITYQKLFVESATQLAAHIRRHSQAGRLRPVHPDLAARAFLGMLLMYMVISHLFGEGQPQAFVQSDAQVLDGMIDLLLHGLRQD